MGVMAGRLLVLALSSWCWVESWGRRAQGSQSRGEGSEGRGSNPL